MTTASVFGLGYVGSVTAACLADSGIPVIGVDVNPVKVELINAGRTPVIEEGLGELIAQQVARGNLRATSDADEAIGASEISLICVGTPSRRNDSLDLSYVRNATREIGQAIARKGGAHTVVVRSTMLPGTTEETVIPLLEETSGRKVGVDLGVCYNPEFLREGTSIADFRTPAYTVIGSADEDPGEPVIALYRAVEAPLVHVPIRVAEMLKYASNSFHALKVAFANEIGVLCKEQGVDSHALMDLFCRDKKLNISRAYLRPGFAFGGSCLPKDLRALVHQAHTLDLFPPVLESILPSNRRHVDAAYQLIRGTGRRRIGVLGFSFKEGTDDLRESPVVELIEQLVGKGFQLSLYDRNVSLASLHGANRAYIEQEIPHISSIMVDSVDEVLARSEVVVLGTADAEFADVGDRLLPEQSIVDLVGVARGANLGARYHGIAW